MVSERVWTPLPKQQEVLDLVDATPEEELAFIGYGGAAGGAKTNLLAQFAIHIALSCAGSNTLVGRQTMKDLKPTTLAEFDKRLPPQARAGAFNGGPVYRDVRDPKWPPGVKSRVYFREVKDAKNGIGSEEFGWILLEEAHEIAKQDIMYLFSRLRHKPEKKRGMILAFNPFPSFVVDCFIDGSDAISDEAGSVVHQHFVPSRIADNTHLPPNYAETMRIAYKNEPFLLSVLLEGNAGVVPHAIYGMLNDPEMQRITRADDIPEEVRFVRGATGWDWGTSVAHKAAGVLGIQDSSGIVWIVDAWESALGSSDELKAVAGAWRTEWKKPTGHSVVTTARYDASQGSLRDDLSKIFPDTDKGVRDVEGRIRVGRGVVSSYRIRFLWSNPEVRKLYKYLTLYHRDDDDAIVEEMDDMVDAFHYMLYALEVPRAAVPGNKTTTMRSDRPGQSLLGDV
ncbi:MAG: phage terminase large subunit [Hyphomicrobiaceae bacterium]